jgi:hypothetical protein
MATHSGRLAQTRGGIEIFGHKLHRSDSFESDGLNRFEARALAHALTADKAKA